jgi:Glyoxalase/Bleomycin resistance protein/Dioxygenase superfamily
VNLAARVTASAEGGELVVTDHVRTAVGDLRGVAFDGPYTRSLASGLKIELGRSDDSHVHFRHLGFCAEDVDDAHESLVEAGMESSEAPHRRDFARMYTSFLKQPGGLEVQLVNYD